MVLCKFERFSANLRGSLLGVLQTPNLSCEAREGIKAICEFLCHQIREHGWLCGEVRLHGGVFLVSEVNQGDWGIMRLLRDHSERFDCGWCVLTKLPTDEALLQFPITICFSLVHWCQMVQKVHRKLLLVTEGSL